VNGIDPNGLFGGMVGLGISMAIGGNMRGSSSVSASSAMMFFNTTYRPVLELWCKIILVYAEIMHFVNFMTNSNNEYTQTTAMQARIKFNLTTNVEVTISPIGYRVDSVSRMQREGAFTHSVTVRIKFPSLRSVWTLGGVPALQATFQVKHSLLNGVEGIAGTGSFTNRWETNWGENKLFVEIGCSLTYNNDTWNKNKWPFFSVYGRLVYDYINDRTSNFEQTSGRIVISQYRLGHDNAADSD
jgi:hypothetical protein